MGLWEDDDERGDVDDEGQGSGAEHGPWSEYGPDDEESQYDWGYDLDIENTFDQEMFDGDDWDITYEGSLTKGDPPKKVNLKGNYVFAEIVAWFKYMQDNDFENPLRNNDYFHLFEVVDKNTLTNPHIFEDVMGWGAATDSDVLIFVHGGDKVKWYITCTKLNKENFMNNLDYKNRNVGNNGTIVKGLLFPYSIMAKYQKYTVIALNFSSKKRYEKYKKYFGL